MGPTKIVQAGAFEIADNALTRAFVELAGFEPATSSLRTRCSARLSYSPLREVNCTGGWFAGQIAHSLGRASRIRDALH